jgi:ABC-2 type transport system ATP-binding protein
VRAGSIAELTAGTDTVLVRTPHAAQLAGALTAQGITPHRPDPATLQVRGMSLAQVGHVAFTAGVELHELSMQRFDLEQLFFALTEGAAGQPPPTGPQPPPTGQQPVPTQGGAPWSA